MRGAGLGAYGLDRHLNDVIAALQAALDKSGTRARPRSRDRGIRPRGDLDYVHGLIESPDPTLAVAAIRLAGAWKLESTRAKLEKRAATDAGDRGRAALVALVDLGGPPSMDAFDKWSAETNPYPLRVRAPQDSPAAFTVRLTLG